jgi:hypothetical protein
VASLSVMSVRRRVALVGLVVASSGCSQEGDPRLSALETRIAQEQVKLDAIRQQVATAEARAEAARIEAEYQGCRAQVKEVRAEVERRRSVCAKDVADHNFCLAQNSEREATSGLWGCGLGIVAAAFSAGAAAPWALGGCAVGMGTGAAAADQCPAPICTNEMDHAASDVLAERGCSHCQRATQS